MSGEVDVAVVQEHVRAEAICKALKHAGIQHVEFWPEHMLDRGMRVHHGPDNVGPFHIRVREEDLAEAKLALSTTGLLDEPDTPT